MNFKAAFLAAFFILLTSGQLFASGAVRVESLSGTVSYKTKSSDLWLGVRESQLLKKGDSLKTGTDGWVKIVFEGGERVVVGSSSEFKLDKYKFKKKKRSAFLSLIKGKVRVFVNKFGGRTRFNLKTPTSTAGVKGTDFTVYAKNDSSVLFTNQGVVEARGDRGDKKDVTAGNLTENSKGFETINPLLVKPGTEIYTARENLNNLLSKEPPTDGQLNIAANIPEAIARWNINYSHYLVDSKQFAKALHVLTIALDFSDDRENRSDIRLERATLSSIHLKDYDSSLADYKAILEDSVLSDSHKNKETAAYSIVTVYSQMKNKKKTLQYINSYLETYPDGRNLNNIKIIKKSLEKK